MSFKDILKNIRAEIRSAYKNECRVSVRENRGGYSYSITIAIESGDFSKAEKIVKKYYDPQDTDTMTDYFNPNFYYHITDYMK